MRRTSSMLLYLSMHRRTSRLLGFTLVLLHRTAASIFTWRQHALDGLNRVLLHLWVVGKPHAGLLARWQRAGVETRLCRVLYNPRAGTVSTSMDVTGLSLLKPYRPWRSQWRQSDNRRLGPVRCSRTSPWQPPPHPARPCPRSPHDWHLLRRTNQHVRRRARSPQDRPLTVSKAQVAESESTQALDLLVQWESAHG